MTAQTVSPFKPLTTKGVDCLDSFSQCETCNSEFYKHELSTETTTCTHEDDIPDGLGKNEALKKLVECLSTGCQVCASDFEDCSACLNPLTDGLVESDVSADKKKCLIRPLDPPPLENEVDPDHSFTIEGVKFRDDTSTIRINFNLRCTKRVQTSAISIELFNSDRTKKIELEYLRGRMIDDNYGLALEVNIKENVEKGILVVHFLNVATFFEENNQENSLNLEKVELKDVSYYSIGEERAVKTIANVGNGALKVTSILYYLISTSMALFLMKLFQMIDYLVFFNVQHPKNLRTFLGVMGQGPVDDIPNFFSFLSDGRCSKVKERFSDEGMTCQIFQSYGNYFMIILGFVCFKLVLSAVYHLLDFFEKDPVWLRKLHFRFMSSQFWLGFFDAIQLDLYLNAMVALTSFKGGSTIAVFNYFFSIALIIVSLGIIIFLFVKIRFYQKITGYETISKENLDKLFTSR